MTRLTLLAAVIPLASFASSVSATSYPSASQAYAKTSATTAFLGYELAQGTGNGTQSFQSYSPGPVPTQVSISSLNYEVLYASASPLYVTANAFAYSDLASGRLGGLGFGSCEQPFASNGGTLCTASGQAVFFAQLQDVMTFTPGANGLAKVVFTFHGTTGGSGQTGSVGTVSSNIAFYPLINGTIGPALTAAIDGNGAPNMAGTWSGPGWTVGSTLLQFNEVDATFEAFLPLALTSTYLVSMGLSGDIQGGHSLDFSHTSGLNFLLSEGTTFSSQSGVFGAVGSLTQGVPEPSVWLMMLVGFGLIGGLMRSKGKQAFVRLA